jgi:hypothetical protein
MGGNLPTLSFLSAIAKFFVALIGGVLLLCLTQTFFAVAAIPHPDRDDEEELTKSSGLHVHMFQIFRLTN